MTIKRCLQGAGLLLACGAALISPASAQHFKQVTGTLTQVAAGRTEVFGVGTTNQVYRYSPGIKTFVQIPGTLAQVAVGGGTLSQKDEVWGVGTAGQIYHFNFATKTFVQVPGSLAQIVVGEGRSNSDNCHPYEVWGLDASDNIFRYNYCTPKHFDQIPGSLSHIATGGGALWGLNSSAQIYYYDFISLSPNFVQIPGSLQQIVTNGADAWGVDGSGNTYRFDPVNQVFPLYGSLGFTQVAAGGDGVWFIFDFGGNVDVLNYTEVTPSTTYQVAMTQLAVGYGAGVWAIDSSNRVYTFVRP